MFSLLKLVLLKYKSINYALYFVLLAVFSFIFIVVIFYLDTFFIVEYLLFLDSFLANALLLLLLISLNIYVFINYSNKKNINNFIILTYINYIQHKKYFWLFRDLSYLLRNRQFIIYEVLGNFLFVLLSLFFNKGNNLPIIIFGFYTLYIPNLYYTLNFCGYEANELVKYSYYRSNYKIILLNKIFLSMTINFFQLLIFSSIILFFDILLSVKIFIILVGMLLSLAFIFIGIETSKNPSQYSFYIDYINPVIPYNKIAKVFFLLLFSIVILYYYLIYPYKFLLVLILLTLVILIAFLVRKIYKLLQFNVDHIRKMYFK